MISLSGLDMPWLDPAMRTRGRETTRTAVATASRSDFPCPRVLTGAVEIRSQVDGKTYTCRKAYRDSLRHNGMIELGNEAIPEKEAEPSINEADIALAYEQCEQGAGVLSGNIAEVRAEAIPEGWQGTVEESIADGK